MAEKAISVEVLIVSYCHEKWIEQTITSVLSQRYSKNLSITLIDDFSTDATVKVAERLLEKSGIRFKITVNSRRRFPEFGFWWDAIESSQADYVAILDGDDFWISPKKIEMQVLRLEKNRQIALSHTDFLIVQGPNYTLPRKMSFEQNNNSFEIVDGLQLSAYNSIVTSSVLLRREFLPSMPNGYNNLRVADYPLWALISDGKLIEKVKIPMVCYRIHQDNFWVNSSIETKLTDELVTRTFIMHNVLATNRDEWRNQTDRFIKENFVDLAFHYKVSNDLTHAKNDLKWIKQSFSWRITRPMRLTHEFLIKTILSIKIKLKLTGRISSVKKNWDVEFE